MYSKIEEKPMIQKTRMKYNKAKMCERCERLGFQSYNTYPWRAFYILKHLNLTDRRHISYVVRMKLKMCE